MVRDGSFFNPHHYNGAPEHSCAGLQASRPGFDRGWTLEAMNVQGGTPPADFVQVIIGLARPKWGYFCYWVSLCCAVRVQRRLFPFYDSAADQTVS